MGFFLPFILSISDKIKTLVCLLKLCGHEIVNFV